MPNPLKLASLWRVIKDLDLEGLRTAARARFTLAIASATPMTRRSCGNC